MGQTDRPTDRPTNRPTDKARYRSSLPELKNQGQQFVNRYLQEYPKFSKLFSNEHFLWWCKWIVDLTRFSYTIVNWKIILGCTMASKIFILSFLKLKHMYNRVHRRCSFDASCKSVVLEVETIVVHGRWRFKILSFTEVVHWSP